MTSDLNELAPLAEVVARKAGDTTLGFYRKQLRVDTKDDGSPITEADRGSHRVIVESLSGTGIPIVSEEGDDPGLGISRYWLVDPLDGTKDFLAGNDEFTVNIGLIEAGRPVLGVLYAPALDELYVGTESGPAWRELRSVRTMCPSNPKSNCLRMAVSRFHDHPDSARFALANGVNVQVPIGSALKYGRLAYGEVDVYPRFVGTSEWDTAAGQAVLEASGGQILDLSTGGPMKYGKPHRRNGRFIAFRAAYLKKDFEFQNF